MLEIPTCLGPAAFTAGSKRGSLPCAYYRTRYKTSPPSTFPRVLDRPTDGGCPDLRSLIRLAGATCRDLAPASDAPLARGCGGTSSLLGEGRREPHLGFQPHPSDKRGPKEDGAIARLALVASRVITTHFPHQGPSRSCSTVGCGGLRGLRKLGLPGGRPRLPLADSSCPCRDKRPFVLPKHRTLSVPRSPLNSSTSIR